MVKSAKQVPEGARCANQEGVFHACRGERINGHLRKENGDVTLIFESGWGLTWNRNGAYWAERPDEIESVVQDYRKRLAATGAEVRRMLELAGE